jgi:hypothetical protein
MFAHASYSLNNTLTQLQKEILYFVALIVGIMLVMIVTVIIIW